MSPSGIGGVYYPAPHKVFNLKYSEYGVLEIVFKKSEALW